MIEFIPREKLSKKAKRELDKKARVVWAMDPRTRCPRSPSAYSRAKEKSDMRKYL